MRILEKVVAVVERVIKNKLKFERVPSITKWMTPVTMNQHEMMRSWVVKRLYLPER
jgi:hypothetical protein